MTFEQSPVPQALPVTGLAVITNAAAVGGRAGSGIGIDWVHLAEAIPPAVRGQAENESWVWIVPLGQRQLPPEVRVVAEAAAHGPVPVTPVFADGEAEGTPLRFEAVRQEVEGLRGLGLGLDALVVVRVA